jgi:hypothetical protein
MQMKKPLLNILVILLSVSPCVITTLYSQDTIYLVNPSFEDVARKGGEYSAPIRGWHDCGLSAFPGETPPDIHSGFTPFWDVNLLPFEGSTYLGLVVRYNGTYESLSQALQVSLKANTCYFFSAALARSEQYLSATSRTPGKLENFTYPVVLNIWGGNQFCSRAELLATTTPVDHSDWSYYDFIFRPKENVKYITIEAFYNTPIPEAYNGHIMVDALSPITEISCE